MELLVPFLFSTETAYSPGIVTRVATMQRGVEYAQRGLSPLGTVNVSDVPLFAATCMTTPVPKMIVLSDVNPLPVIVTDVPTAPETGVSELI